MIRRIYFASNSPLLDTIKSSGAHVEYQRNLDGTDKHDTVVASFPFAYPEGTPVAKEFSAIDQLEVIRRLQREWSDNSVSCTVYYRLEELPAIQEYLEKNYNDNFKSLSFLLHTGHGFDQAPYEEITKEQYEELCKKYTTITKIGDVKVEFDSQEECSSGVCPVK